MRRVGESKTANGWNISGCRTKRQIRVASRSSIGTAPVKPFLSRNRNGLYRATGRGGCSRLAAVFPRNGTTTCCFNSCPAVLDFAKCFSAMMPRSSPTPKPGWPVRFPSTLAHIRSDMDLSTFKGRVQYPSTEMHQHLTAKRCYTCKGRQGMKGQDSALRFFPQQYPNDVYV